MNDDGTFQQNIFSQVTGVDYIATAFKAARAADPVAKLYANDFNIEGPGPKSTAYQNLIKNLSAQGVRIDGIGMQAHFIVGELPPNIQQNIQAFTNLSVEVAITELDVRMTLPATPALLAQQEKDYQTVISACNAVPKCVGVTLWDFTDKFSWVPGAFPGQGAACPWDDVRAFIMGKRKDFSLTFDLAEFTREVRVYWDREWVWRITSNIQPSCCCVQI